MKIYSLMVLTCAGMLGLSSSVLGDTTPPTTVPQGSGEHIILRLRGGTQQPPRDTNTTPTNSPEAATTEPLPQVQSEEKGPVQSSSTNPSTPLPIKAQQESSETTPTPTPKPEIIGLEAVTVPSAASFTQTHAVQPLRTVLGFELKRDLKYPIELAIQNELYRNLPVGKVLIDAIGLKDQNQKPILLTFSLRKVSQEHFVLIPTPLNIVKQTKEDGLFCLNAKNNKLVYYNGFLLQTAKWKDLKVNEHLIDGLVKLEDRGTNVTIKDEITFDFVKKENPIENIPILWEAK